MDDSLQQFIKISSEKESEIMPKRNKRKIEIIELDQEIEEEKSKRRKV